MKQRTSGAWSSMPSDREGYAGYMVTRGSFCVATVSNVRETGEANAAFIVTACNSHDALVAALERVSEQWHYAHPVDGRGRATYLECTHPDCVAARAALAGE